MPAVGSQLFLELARVGILVANSAGGRSPGQTQRSRFLVKGGMASQAGRVQMPPGQFVGGEPVVEGYLCPTILNMAVDAIRFAGHAGGLSAVGVAVANGTTLMVRRHVPRRLIHR